MPRVQRRKPARFARLGRTPHPTARGVEIVHGPLREGGRDCVQSFWFDDSWTSAQAARFAEREWMLSMPPPAARPPAAALLEDLVGIGQPEAVDAEKGIIRGCKVLGLVSSHGYNYSREAVKAAASLYEGTKVNLNHSAKPGQPRRVEDRIGKLVNVRFDEGRDSLVADLHFNPKHPMGPAIAFDAANRLDVLGFSHHAHGKTVTRPGAAKPIVESISSVTCVDLVADPATTKSLFESATIPTDDAGFAGEMIRLARETIGVCVGYLEADPANPVLNEHATWAVRRLADDLAKLCVFTVGAGPSPESADPFAAQVAAIAADAALSPAAKAQRVLALSEGRPTPTINLSEESDMDPKDITLELLEQQRPDLLKAIAEKADASEAQLARDAEVKTLREECDRFRAEKAQADRAAKAQKAVEAAKLPAHLVTDVFLEQVAAAPDDAAVAKLIEDRKAIGAASKVKPPASKGSTLSEAAGRSDDKLTLAGLVGAYKRGTPA